MSQDTTYIFCVEVPDPRVMSTNDMYMHPVRKTKSGRYMSYPCRSPQLKTYQEFYRTIFSEKITDDHIKEMNKHLESCKNAGFKLVIDFGMPENDLLKHDASNMVKALEDCIVSRTGIDDSYNMQVVVNKCLYSTFNGQWMMRVHMYPSQATRIYATNHDSSDGYSV